MLRPCGCINHWPYSIHRLSQTAISFVQHFDSHHFILLHFPFLVWATLVRDYVEALNSGKSPSVKHAIDAMAQLENSELLKECVDSYQEKMKDILKESPPPTDEVR